MTSLPEPLSPLMRSIGEHKWADALLYLKDNPNMKEIEVCTHRVWDSTFTAIQEETRYLLSRTTTGFERKIQKV